MMKSLYLKYLQQFIVLLLLALLSTQVLAGKRTTTYMHTDALGSVVAASDKDGNLLWRKQYMPFGSEINRDPNLKELSYTGKKFDAELGLSYSGARYYDPSLGRFGGIDPATALENVEPNPMMFNRYAYANNNPYKFVDPDGREVGLAHRGDVYVDMLAADQISRDEYSAYLRAEATGGLMATGGVGTAAARGLYLANAYRVNQGVLIAGETLAETTVVVSAAKGVKEGIKIQRGRVLGDSIVRQRGALGESPPRLKRIHSDETLSSGSNKFSLDFHRNQSTDDIIRSLKPGGDEALRIKPDGRIINGNTRIKVLEERGFDINSLPREVIE